MEGLSLVTRHNRVLFPVVERFGGRVVKTIGDAIMAVFESAPEAASCALELHRALARENEAGGEPIHIRVGVHLGRVLQSGGDVFGDAVNTAARVAQKAGADQVLVSEALFSRLPGEKLRAVPQGALELKGKSEPVKVVALPWRDGAGGAQASAAEARAEESTPGPELFVLELQVAAQALRVAALEGAQDKGTVKAYAEVPVSPGELDGLANRIATFMGPGAARSYLDRVREHGGELFRHALSERARRRLVETRLSFLRLQLDEQLVHLPWEVMHDGEQFLAVRFAVGRLVFARMESPPALAFSTGHALVVSNPTGDLPAAAREGEAVAGLLREGYRGEVRHLEGPVSRAAFLEALPGSQLLHFAGHAEPSGQGRGGFLLADGLLTPEQIEEAGGAAPALVFANGCHASTGMGWVDAARGRSTLASAFLLRGARHVVSPMWEIPDADAFRAALRFYENALAGVPFGEALRRARQALLGAPSAPLSFAGYVLYGDPRQRFSEESVQLATSPRTRSLPSATPPPGSVRFEAPADTHRAAAPRRVLVLGILGGLACLLGGGLFLARRPPPPESASPNAERAQGAPAAPSGAVARREGPVRLAVLPFKNLSGDRSLDFLSEGLTEALATDFGRVSGIRLVERGQIELELKEIEFSQSKYVDPALRAALGKIAGAEVVVLGAYQRVGKAVRFTARLVDVETGEILHGLKVENRSARREEELLELQDALSAEVRSAAAAITSRLRR